MNKLILAATAINVVFAAIAESPAPAQKERLNTLERKEKLEALVNQRVGGFLEKQIVCFGYRLAHKSDIVWSSERVNIRRHELSIVVSQRTFSLTE